MIYKTERKDYKNYIFKKLSEIILGFCIAIILYYILHKDDFKMIGLIPLTIFLIFYVFKEGAQKRLIELSFDATNKYILFTYRNLFSKAEQKILRFENARIEESKSRNKKDKPQKVLRLYFFKNKMEVFELNKYKDGYSYETMKQIADAAREFSIPII